MLGLGVQKIFNESMNRPYVLDFDGLDGIYDLDVPVSVQVEIEKAHVAHVNGESSDFSDINGDYQFPTKKRYNLFPKAALLMIGLIGYLSFISLHDDESDIEPLSKQIVRSPVGRVTSTESDSKPSDTQYRVPESEQSKTESTIKPPDGKSRTDEVDEKPPVVAGAGLETNLSVPVDSVQRQHGSHVEGSAASANGKIAERTDIDSKQKIKSQSKHLNKEVSSLSDTVTQAETKTDLLSDHRLNSGNQGANFVLQFLFNESTVTDLSSTKLLDLKNVAKSCPGTIQIIGHTCNLGPYISNQAVGMVRATWVKDLLVKIGFSADGIKVASAGHNKPIASNRTYAGRVLNRRVTVGCLSESDKIKEETR
jgi:outer membrane protein OmpA-like peptidoglycan-associated protein